MNYLKIFFCCLVIVRTLSALSSGGLKAWFKDIGWRLPRISQRQCWAVDGCSGFNNIFGKQRHSYEKYVRIYLAALLLVSTLLLFAIPVHAIDSGNIIERVEIEGNERVQDSSIRYYISNIEGKPYSQANVRKDIKKLYSLGYFKDIQVDLIKGEKGLVIAYIFKEKPVVGKVEVKGVKELTKKEILEKIELKKGKHFNPSIVLKDIETIKEIYREKGYYLVKVEVEKDEPGNNQVMLKYVVTEGHKVYVSSVRFNGNSRFSDRQLLKLIDTKTRNILSWVTESGTYKKDILKTDMLKIESFYHNNGYINLRIEEPRVEIDKEVGKIYIDFFLNEGAQFKVGKIDVEGDEVYSEDKIRKVMRLKEGDVFNRSLYARDIFSITDLYLVKGYAFTDVIQKTNIDKDKKVVTLKIKVDRGNRVYIGRINITGNEKTRDKVIRREMRLKEGSLFDSSKLVRSRERLNRLGYFEKVDIRQRSREDDLIDLDIEVTETSTGSLSMGAGYSSVENAIFFAQVSQRNFLGKGQKLSLEAQLSSLKKDYTLSFSEPYLFDKELSAGFSIFNTESDLRSYTSTDNGGSVSLGRSLGEYTWGNISYKHNIIDTIISDAESASSYIKEQEGTWITSAITNSIKRDSRDDYFNPSKGSRLNAMGTYAGGMLGGRNYYRINMEASTYHTIFWKFIVMMHGKVGYSDAHSGDKLPIFEHFFLGGSSSLRGYNFNDVGPLDSQKNSIGGKAQLLFNAELQYPFTQFVRGFFFLDRGQIYGSEGDLSRTTDRNFDLNNMRSSWGFGVKFFSPVGPISLAWGFKIDPYPNESGMEFHFDIGRAF